jgi:hypothetical protein
MAVPRHLLNFRQDCASFLQKMMEGPVSTGEMDNASDLEIQGLLRPLSLVDLETLLAALDPRLDGFGSGPSCLDDARAFLARLASGTSNGGSEGTVADLEAMEAWIETWRSAGGNRQTLRLMVQTLMAERLARKTMGDDQAGEGRGGTPT